MLNRMCMTCKKFAAGQCAGTDCQTWTACALKECGTPEDLREALRANLAEFYRLSEAATCASDEWHDDPDNKELAKVFADAYNAESRQREKVVSQLGAFLPYGRQTILKMVFNEHAELLAALESREALAALV